MAEAKLMYPFASMQGNLDDKGKLYIRRLNGKLIVQHKPNRTNHIPTQAEAANQQQFGARYGTARKKVKTN